VLERVIDDWLTKTTERSFQAPFCQMLAARGETVIHSSRHSAMELGKDVISIANSGRIHAYQLKTAPQGRLSLSEWRKGLEQQAFQLVVTGVDHPSVGRNKRHHRSFFVINGHINEEVAAAIRGMNQSWADSGQKDYKLETIVRGQLADMATSLQSAFWPAELADVNVLLELYLDSGLGQLPKAKMAQLLEAAAGWAGARHGKRSKAHYRRLMASAGVLTALALTRFTGRKNHLAEIEGWTMCLATILGIAQRNNLPSADCGHSIDLIAMFIRRLIEELVQEVQDCPHLVVGHPVSDRSVRKIRITHLVALFSVLWLWRRQDGSNEDSLDELLRDFCVKHSRNLAFWGEAAAPQLIAAYWGLRSMAPQSDTDGLLLSGIDMITAINGQKGTGRFFSPYYDAEDVLRRYLLGIQEEDITESFRRRSHSIESFLALVVRENLKQSLRLRWQSISHLMFAEFETKRAWQIFRWRNKDEGRLVSRMPSELQSWGKLRKQYDPDNQPSPPRLFQSYPALAMLFLLCYPHRLQPSWVVWLDSETRG
jgi:hypothetical protein